jgi:ribosomal protein S1
MTQFDWWEAAEEKKRTGEHVQADVYDANKGGLIVKLLGLRAFLPAKLTAVGVDGNWAALVGERIEVRILELKSTAESAGCLPIPLEGRAGRGSRRRVNASALGPLDPRRGKVTPNR